MNFTVELEVRENGRKSPQYTLDSDINGEVTFDALIDYMKATLIFVAKDVLEEEQARGFDKTPVTTVDNRRDKSILDVKPFGTIEFAARQNMKDILLETYDSLLYRSPILTGKYISSHVMVYNNQVVAIGQNSLNAWLASNPNFQDSDVIKFIDTQPYARKLERQGITAQKRSTRSKKSTDKRGRSGDRILAPNGVYYLTAQAIKRKYKRNSSIKFGFTSGAALGLADKFKTVSSGARGGGRKRAGRFTKTKTYFYPTISILVNEAGIL